MPIYCYGCQKCDVEVEIIHSMKELETPSEEVLSQISCNEKTCTENVCDGEKFKQIPQMFGHNRFNSLSPSEKKGIMKARSHAHYKKEIADRRHDFDQKIIKEIKGN